MKKIFAAIALAFAPAIASAQQLGAINNINDVTAKFTSILNTTTVIIVAVAVLWIIINVVRYLVGGKDSEKRKEGGMRILFGVIGLFVIISIWGLVSIFKNSFVTNDTARQNVGNVQIQPGTVPQIQ